MQIPHDELSPIALRNVLTEIVTRDGTELTDTDVKIEQVVGQLQRGKAVLLYDADSGSFSLRPVSP